MKKLEFVKTEFIRSAVEEAGFPTYYSGGKKLPEVALVGRSNVGKSSLINHLTQKKDLAKTSSVPGKTQTLNFYLIDERIALVDLPGYGFSKVSHSTKKLWADSLEKYLLSRDELCLILCIIDLRRTLSEEDAGFIEWAKTHQKPLFFIFSKSDKLSSKEKEESMQSLIHSIQKILPDSAVPHICYSIKEPTCRNVLRHRLEQLLTER